MTLKEITLLTEDEFKKYRPIISVIKNWWWLRTPISGYAGYVRTVDGTGSLVQNYCSRNCYDNYGGVRPFCIFDLEMFDNRFWYKPEKLLGTKIKYGNYQWTILDGGFGELYALCDNVIVLRRFDIKSNDWDTSELKQWLETEGLKRITD